MSEYITLYQQRQGIRQHLKEVRQRVNHDEYQKLKSEELRLTIQLNKLCNK
jgi:phage-related minor tail protein